MKISLTPPYPSAVCEVPNTERVLSAPAWPMSSTAKTTKTSTSKMPSTVPNRAEARTPKYPASAMIAAPSSDHGHHSSAG